MALCDFHDSVCSACGGVIPEEVRVFPYRSQCPSSRPETFTPSLRDTALQNEVEIEVFLVSPPCSKLGERTMKRAKSACQNSAMYYPVYQCPIYRLCSPFGATSDPELIHSCGGCPDYTKATIQSGTAPDETPKI